MWGGTPVTSRTRGTPTAPDRSSPLLEAARRLHEGRYKCCGSLRFPERGEERAKFSALGAVSLDPVRADLGDGGAELPQRAGLAARRAPASGTDCGLVGSSGLNFSWCGASAGWERTATVRPGAAPATGEKRGSA